MYKQKKIITRNLRPVLIFTLFMVLAAFGTAQAQDDTGQMKEKAPAEITEVEVASFAKAFSGIRKIQDEYTKEAQGAGNDQDIKDLQQKYQDKMIQEVKNNGLTIKRYNEIAQAMQNDEELQNKVQSRMSEDQQ